MTRKRAETRNLRVPAVELMRRPGLTKEVVVELAPADLDINDPRIVGPVSVDLTATSTIDGILVAGNIGAVWEAKCRRCATTFQVAVTNYSDELYQFEVTDDDAYAIDGDRIDLAPVVRQYVLLGAPDDELCRQECAGLCASCGADLNDGDCDCSDEVLDPRWAALSGLELDDGDADA